MVRNHKFTILCLTILISITVVKTQSPTENICRNLVQIVGIEIARKDDSCKNVDLTVESAIATTTTSTPTTASSFPETAPSQHETLCKNLVQIVGIEKARNDDFCKNADLTSFQKNDTKIETKNNTCAEASVCVPYFLCPNGTALAIHGSSLLINLRGAEDGTSLCPDLEHCCPRNESIDSRNLPDEVKKQLYPEVTREGCGYRNEEGINVRIIGNALNETEFGEFPWMAAVFIKKQKNGIDGTEYRCGGSIIHPSVVITALHYVFKKEPNDLVVRGGEWDLTTIGEHIPHQDRMVKDIIKHANYNKGGLFNDIALLILTEPYVMTTHLQTVCLPPPNTVFDGQRCFVTGWGASSSNENAKYSTILKKIVLPIIPHDQCQIDVRKIPEYKSFNVHESFICAGGEPGKDACKGDGGSPLVCQIPNTDDQYYQAGIVSWGIGCGDNGVPAFYASIPYLRSWIDEQLALKNIETASFTYTP